MANAPSSARSTWSRYGWVLIALLLILLFFYLRPDKDEGASSAQLAADRASAPTDPRRHPGRPARRAPTTPALAAAIERETRASIW
jgi:hypothetical protein